MKKKFGFRIATLLLLISVGVTAQEQKDGEKPGFDLSLEELMNIKISTASKKEELQLNAPISSYTITQADIIQSGATNIPEAMRLAPGIIVREETNGNYSVHIRGLDNIQRTNAQINTTNLLTLVMIDGRPVFNNLIGGTMWESLPVSLYDLDRIEIVRGPASALYGPNAVSGVINLITKKNDKKWSSSVRAQAGGASTKLASMMLGHKTDKWNISVTGNYQHRDRFNSDYYDAIKQSFVAPSNLSNPPLSNPLARYSQPNLSQDIFGYNAFAGFSPSENVEINFNAGGNTSSSQHAFAGDGIGVTPLSISKFQNGYVSTSIKSHKLTGRAAMVFGHDNLRNGAVPSEYDYHVEDGIVEYEITPLKKVIVKPGLAFQNATYDDSKYFEKNGSIGFLGGSKSITTYSGSLRADLNPTEKLRLVLAGRYDKFSSPDRGYFSYQFASTYNISEESILRLTISKSRAGSFIGDHFLNVNIPIAPSVNFQLIGNRNLQVSAIQQVEIGFRSKLTERLSFDIDVFTQQIEDLIAAVASSPLTQQIQNLQATARQNGVTVSLNIVPTDRVQIKPFFTYQETTVYNLDQLVNGVMNGNISQDKHRSTPPYYGGFFASYRPTTKFAVSVSSYFYGSHLQYSYYDPFNTSGYSSIQSKCLLNSKMSYQVTSGLSLDLTIRNLLNDDSRESFALDRNGRMILGGLTFKY